MTTLKQATVVRTARQKHSGGNCASKRYGAGPLPGRKPHGAPKPTRDEPQRASVNIEAEVVECQVGDRAFPDLEADGHRQDIRAG